MMPGLVLILYDTGCTVFLSPLSDHFCIEIQCDSAINCIGRRSVKICGPTTISFLDVKAQNYAKLSWRRNTVKYVPVLRTKLRSLLSTLSATRGPLFMLLLTFLKLQNLVWSFVSPLVSTVYSGFCSVRGEYRFSSLVARTNKRHHHHQSK